MPGRGGIIYEFMRWTLDRGCYPAISMGAFAGGTLLRMWPQAPRPLS